MKKQTGDLVKAVQKLEVVIDQLMGRVERLERTIGRCVFPAEEMGLLAGELRSLRYLLDTKREFGATDKLHIALEDARRRREAAPEGGPVQS